MGRDERHRNMLYLSEWWGFIEIWCIFQSLWASKKYAVSFRDFVLYVRGIVCKFFALKHLECYHSFLCIGGGTHCYLTAPVGHLRSVFPHLTVYIASVLKDNLRESNK